MTIADILQNRILPFDIEDEKMRRLFSFFLHSAPTIESATAANIPADRLMSNWNTYIFGYSRDDYAIIASNCTFNNYLQKHHLDNDVVLSRKAKGFVCKRKATNETDYECLLRHLRNAIAHSNVYMINAGNRKFILFEDFNQNKKQNARILLSQTELMRLKSTIMQ